MGSNVMILQANASIFGLGAVMREALVCCFLFEVFNLLLPRSYLVFTINRLVIFSN